MSKRLLWFTGLFACFVLPAIGRTTRPYERQEVMISMGDGVKLNTVIYTLKTSKEPLPFLLTRTQIY